MNITIRKMEAADLGSVDRCNEPFVADSRLVLHVQDGKIDYTAVPAEKHEKRYSWESVDYSSYLDNPDQAVFFAYVDGELAGQLRIHKKWNAYAYIDDIEVKAEFRKQGIGRALIMHAVEWAREGKFPGLMLETQDNNVAACRFYESCGFQLGGFDRYLYKGQQPDTDEIGLFWYLLF